MVSTLKAVLARTYSIPLLIVLLEIAARAGWVTSRLLPRPSSVFATLGDELASGALVMHTTITLGRALSGFGIAVVIGIALATLLARSRPIERWFGPTFFLSYPVPKIALFPVVTFIFGIGSPSKIAFTALECIYPITIATFSGIRNIQTRLVWAAQNMGASQWTILRRVIIPASLTSVFAGLRIALPMSIIIVIVTEMIGDSRGLGAYINVQGTRFQYGKVYAAILTIGVVGFILDQILVHVGRIALRGMAVPGR